MFRIPLFTALTMIAFAANSILCRLALLNPENDAVSFTLLRLFSGAMMLMGYYFKQRGAEQVRIGIMGTVFPPLMLFSYALFFSLSYVSIGAGTGALILFSSVQFTMMTASFLRGHRMKRMESVGIGIAVCGLIYLLLPGLHMPPLFSAAMMALSGISWGFYSLLGQKASRPMLATARNFVFTLPLIIILAIFHPIQLSESGMGYAILSGAITSALGYILWYVILKQLSTSTAAVAQLSVPAIASFFGVLFLGEQLPARLVIASVLILGGILLKIRAR